MADALAQRQKQPALLSLEAEITRTIGGAYESCLGEGPLQQRPKALGQPGPKHGRLGWPCCFSAAPALCGNELAPMAT